jgi:hypothetical protein
MTVRRAELRKHPRSGPVCLYYSSQARRGLSHDYVTVSAFLVDDD